MHTDIHTNKQKQPIKIGNWEPYKQKISEIKKKSKQINEAKKSLQKYH